MDGKVKKSFLYAKLILRVVQGLLLIGVLFELPKVASNLESLVSLIIYIIILAITIFAEHQINLYIKVRIEYDVDTIMNIKDSMFASVDIPMSIIEETGSIVWTNEAFKLLHSSSVIGKNIKLIMPELKLVEAEESQSLENIIKVNDKVYELVTEKFERCNQENKSYVGIYFIDITQRQNLSIRLREERTILGYLCIDNIDEITASIEEVRVPMLLAIIDRKIHLWFKEREVVIARIERDKYIMIFSKKELERMKETKFDLLDEMRGIQVGNELPVTISIGIGHNINSILDSKEDARIAFDLAQGRGGDQAIIKHNDKYTFYGGKTKEVEKSARVKVRLKAYAFKELIGESDKVYVMGHKNIDMDSLGAALGVYRAATLMGKKAQIILNGPTFAVEGLYDRIVQSKEYEDLFISHDNADKEMNKDTLLVVVDTHRKSYVEHPNIIDKADKIVIFDHHRKSTDYIDDAVLTYLEPFISSTCEMIAEILNYLTDKVRLTQIEADALLAGITIDTKNFVLKAGVRTFEAAAFLRRNGADSSRVQLLFQNDMETYKVKAEAIQKVEVWGNDMAITEVINNGSRATIIAAQVADELLNIKGIAVSFVLTVVTDSVYISARALGDNNVQRIMELLGGGGHLGIAGAQLKDTNMDEAKIYLRDAINKYLEEGESK